MYLLSYSIVIQLTSQLHLHKKFEIIVNNQIIIFSLNQAKKPTTDLHVQVPEKENPLISVSSKEKKRLQKEKSGFNNENFPSSGPKR